MSLQSKSSEQGDDDRDARSQQEQDGAHHRQNPATEPVTGLAGSGGGLYGARSLSSEGSIVTASVPPSPPQVMGNFVIAGGDWRVANSGFQFYPPGPTRLM